MNLNLPQDLKFLERLIKTFALTPSWFSLARIFTWFLFFVIVLHFVVPSITPNLPHTQNMQAVGLTPLATTPSDPRYTRLDMGKSINNSIAWVAGSSITIKPDEGNNYTYLPAEVQAFLPEDTQQYVSLKMASRLLDTYTMTLDVIDREPSAIVLLLNPFWIMNDKSSFFKTNMMNRGASAWLNKTDWTMIPLLTSPGNLLWASAGKHHNLIGNGYDYLKLAMPTKPTKKKQTTPIEKPKKLSYNQPLLFWISQRYDTKTDFTAFDTKQWQAKAMAQNNIEESVLGQQLLSQLFSKIKTSNIPTLIYMPPVSDKLERTEAREAYYTVIHQVRAIGKENNAENIYFINHIPKSITKTMEFTDYLHLKNSGKLPEFLGGQISAMMNEHNALKNSMKEARE